MEPDETMEVDGARLEELARESLREHLGAAGLSPWEEGGRVWLGIGEASCRVSAGEPIQHPGLWLVPFWFHLALDGEEREVVRESMAGMGPTPEEAAVRVAHDWVDAVLPPVRMMLDPAFRDEGVRVMDVATLDGETEESATWTMFAAPPLLMGRHAREMAEALERQPPVSLVLDQVTGYLTAGRRHWVKTFLTRFGDSLSGEVMIDNEPDPEALEALKRFAWPPVEGFAGFRQFLILHPDAVPMEPPPELKARLQDLAYGTSPKPEAPERPWWKLW